MSKVIRVFETKNGTFLTTIEYNAEKKTSLATVMVKDWFSVELKENLDGQELPDFDLSEFTIEERTSTKVDEKTGEETTYINKWLFPV
jgi:hypothetical protein